MAQLYHRQMVKHKMDELNLYAKYDFIVVTRSDFEYLCDHPPFIPDALMVPAGMDWTGMNDRHVVGPPHLLKFALNTVERWFFGNHKPWLDCFDNSYCPNLIATEQIQLCALEIEGFIADKHLVRFTPTMFVVKPLGEKNAWRQVTNSAVKYPNEFNRANLTCLGNDGISTMWYQDFPSAVDKGWYDHFCNI